MTIDPSKLGFKKAKRGALRGGSREENAAAIKGILEGEKGPRRDLVVLNAAAGLYVAGLAKSIRDGVARAKESIDSGKALEVLENLIRETNSLSSAP